MIEKGGRTKNKAPSFLAFTLAILTNNNEYGKQEWKKGVEGRTQHAFIITFFHIP